MRQRSLQNRKESEERAVNIIVTYCLYHIKVESLLALKHRNIKTYRYGKVCS